MGSSRGWTVTKPPKSRNSKACATRSSPRCTAKLAARRRRARTLAVPKVELKVPVALHRARRSKKSIKKKVREKRGEILKPNTNCRKHIKVLHFNLKYT